MLMIARPEATPVVRCGAFCWQAAVTDAPPHLLLLALFTSVSSNGIAATTASSLAMQSQREHTGSDRRGDVLPWRLHYTRNEHGDPPSSL